MMRLFILIAAATLLTCAPWSAPLEIAYQAGQVISHSGVAEVIEIGGPHAGLRQLRLEQVLFFIAPEGADGGWRVLGLAEERDALATGMREPQSALFIGHAGARGTWDQASHGVRSQEMLPLWSPQLALGPVPGALPEGAPAEATWPVWAGETRLEGEFTVERLREERDRGRTLDRWRATLRRALSDEQAGVRVLSMAIEGRWDRAAETLDQVQTIATVEWPAVRRQIQARITFTPSGEMLVSEAETRDLPEQVERIAEIIREITRKPQRAARLARAFAADHPGSRLTAAVESLAGSASPEG